MAARGQPGLTTAVVLARIAESIRDHACLGVQLRGPLAGSGAGTTRADLRPVTIKGQPGWQWTLTSGAQVRHENLDEAATLVRLADWLGTAFEQAYLNLRGSRVHFQQLPDTSWRARDQQLTEGPPTPDSGHNRRKQYLIPEGEPCPFLAAIGVMTPAGQVRASMQHKFRQVNRFLELVDDVLDELPATGPLHIIDFGCGKSSLTFALHHLLTRIRGREVRIDGIDRKADVVADCESLARTLDCQGLSFHQGDISDHEPEQPVHMSVSLHACDTATDEALGKGVLWGCQAILAVPCCQHELAQAIQQAALQPIERHGLLWDRFAALATDTLRALALGACGYNTRVVEFIDLEHTPKNVLIRAVRRDMSDDVIRKRLREYAEFRDWLGLQKPHLEQVLGARLSAPHQPEA